MIDSINIHEFLNSGNFNKLPAEEINKIIKVQNVIFKYKLLTNNSLGSKLLNEIINSLDEQITFDLFSYYMYNSISNKVMRAFLKSDNPYIKPYVIKFITYRNVDNDTLKMLYKFYNIKAIMPSKKHFLRSIIEKDSNLLYNIFFDIHKDKINDDLFYHLIELNTIASFANNPKLTPEQINYLIDMKCGEIDIIISENTSLTKHQFDYFLNKSNTRIFHNKALSKEQIQFWMDNTRNSSKLPLLSNPNISEDQIDLILRKAADYYYHPYVNPYINLACNPKISHDRIDFLLNFDNIKINNHLASNPNLSEKHIQYFVDKKEYDQSLVQNPLIKGSILECIINRSSSNNLMRKCSAKNPNLTIDQAIEIIEHRPVVIKNLIPLFN